MNRFYNLRDTIFNKVLRGSKSCIGSYLRCKCDRIPENRRLTVVTVILTVFVLTAFFVFGNACYRIGRGQAATGRIEVGHIEGVELSAPDKGDSLLMKRLNPCYEISGTENENQ